MNRLTKIAGNGLAYLTKVKDDEQEVNSIYPDTLKAILEAIQSLAKYEDLELTPEMIEKQIKLTEEKSEAIDKIYLEKCKEINELSQQVEYYKGIAEAYQIGVMDRNNWISCSHRMPNEEEWLNAYIRNKHLSEFIVMISGANRPTALYLSKDGLWMDGKGTLYNVIEWQPMPEPHIKPQAAYINKDFEDAVNDMVSQGSFRGKIMDRFMKKE